MRISGFTCVKNATLLYFPVKQSIMSILPIVDEFVVALGDCAANDHTREQILSIGSGKIRIIDTVWDTQTFGHGTILAQQTEIARAACTGDWLFYLQSDEAVHEKALPDIRAACGRYVGDARVEGFVFDYRHFWGDYSHVHNAHGWYKREIRIIRNLPDVHSWRDAQSFRHIPDFTESEKDFLRKENTRKLAVLPIGAEIYHYGWVRPPYLMRTKKRNMDGFYHDRARADAMNAAPTEDFDYGPLDRIPLFKGTHPAIIREWMARFDWGKSLQHGGAPDPRRELHKHEKTKNRVQTWIEQHLLGGRELGGFRNYRLL